MDHKGTGCTSAFQPLNAINSLRHHSGNAFKLKWVILFFFSAKASTLKNWVKNGSCQSLLKMLIFRRQKKLCCLCLRVFHVNVGISSPVSGFPHFLLSAFLYELAKKSCTKPLRKRKKNTLFILYSAGRTWPTEFVFWSLFKKWAKTFTRKKHIV